MCSCVTCACGYVSQLDWHLVTQGIFSYGDSVSVISSLAMFHFCSASKLLVSGLDISCSILFKCLPLLHALSLYVVCYYLY